MEIPEILQQFLIQNMHIECNCPECKKKREEEKKRKEKIKNLSKEI